MATAATAQSQVNTPVITGVFVFLTAKPGVAREKILSIIPTEVRETVKLYLEGKIREWYSRSDGRGVVFLLDASDENEARSLMDSLPLSKLGLMDYEYLPVGPLLPLRFLITAPQAQ